MTDVDLSVSAVHVQAEPPRARSVHRVPTPLPDQSTDDDGRLADAVEEARNAGIGSIGILTGALPMADAGSLEHFVRRVASAWAASGIDVALGRRSGRAKRPDGLVEIWDSTVPMPTLRGARTPRIVLADPSSADGTWTDARRPVRVRDSARLRCAAVAYRRRRMITASSSSKDRIVALLECHPSQVEIVAGGIDRCFSAGGRRAATPLVVAAGGLVDSSRFDLLVDILVDTKRFVPDLCAVIVGDGPERSRVEAAVSARGAEQWLTMTERGSAAELAAAYRRAWVVASTSLRAGWDMSLSEAAACGTPAVASDTPDHRIAVAHETSGLLAAADHEFAASLVRLLTDDVLRERLSRGAVAQARRQTWEGCAAEVLSALVAEARARR